MENFNECFLSGLRKFIKENEGFSPNAYFDNDGMTVGFGHLLNPKDKIVSISEETADILFKSDIEVVISDYLHFFKDIDSEINEVRKIALMDMLFTLGRGDFAGFKKMLRAVFKQDWDKAAYEAQHSNWYKQQYPARRDKIITMLRNG